MAHGDVYVAQTTPAHVNHFYRSIIDANEYPGPAVVIVYAPACPSTASRTTPRRARPGSPSTRAPTRCSPMTRGRATGIDERLSLQGNPRRREDWAHAPAGDPVDFLTFARTRGAVRAPLRPSGEPTPEYPAANASRLANWRTLQEQAGLRPAASATSA